MFLAAFEKYNLVGGDFLARCSSESEFLSVHEIVVRSSGQ